MKRLRLLLITLLLVGLAAAGLGRTTASALPGLPIVGGYHPVTSGVPATTPQPLPGDPNIASYAWAGYTYTAPSELSNTWAGWTEPLVGCAQNETSYSYFWVGMQTAAGSGLPLIQ